MTVWKRVWASVTRRKGKSLILFVIIFILGNVMAGAIAIEQSVKRTEQNIKEKLGAEATVELDYPTLWADEKKEPGVFDSLEDVSLGIIKKLGESPYVSYYDYNQEMYLATEKWSDYDDSSRKKSEEELAMPSSLYLKGVNYGPLLAIKEKQIELVEGRTPTADEISQGKKVAVISKELAAANNLRVGDQMAIDNIYYEVSQTGERSPEPSFKQELPLEIIGLFTPLIIEREESKEKSDLDFSREYQDYLSYNTIYLANEIVSTLMLDYFQKRAAITPDDWTEEDVKRESGLYTPLFVLKSAEMAENFKLEAQPLLPKYYQVLTASDQYQAVAGSLNGMKKMATSVLLVSAGATIFILSLVVLLFLRDRKQEIGIYLSFGEARWKIVGQIVAEVLMVGVVAISLSVVSGNLLAKGFSSSLLAINTPAATQSMESFVPTFIATSGVSAGDVASSYEVSLSPGYVGLFYLVGIGTMLFATVLPTIYLLRLNPKKILL